jgi:hypothetical protein
LHGLEVREAFEACKTITVAKACGGIEGRPLALG